MCLVFSLFTVCTVWLPESVQFARYAPLDIAYSRTAAAPSVMYIKTAKNPSEAMVSATVLSVAIREIFF